MLQVAQGTNDLNHDSSCDTGSTSPVAPDTPSTVVPISPRFSPRRTLAGKEVKETVRFKDYVSFVVNVQHVDIFIFRFDATTPS